MKQLIVIAHGSKKASSNQEVTSLAERLKQQMSEQYQDVKAAFQELCSPSISQAVLEAKQAGTKQIDFFPYFLVAGKHVSLDLPKLIAEAQQQYPEIKMRTLPYLGAMENLSLFISQSLCENKSSH